MERSFGTDLRDDALWSRFGNAKYHIFTNRVRFGNRKHRRAARGRVRQAAVPLVVSSTASTLEDFGEPLRIQLLEIVGTACWDIGHASQTGAAASSPARCSAAAATVEDLGEPLHFHWLEWKIELALQQHGIVYTKDLIDDIVKTVS